MAADPWGIDIAYNGGHWGLAPPEIRQALLTALGVDGANAVPPPADAVRVLRPGKPGELQMRGTLRLEDGATLRVDGPLPQDIPLGYHDFESDDGRKTFLIVAPAVCPLPTKKMWAWVAQLYAARSQQSWGIGDLADLRRLGEWSTNLGADLLMINPLVAAAPVVPQEPSPYYPSSRCFRNPLFLRVEEVPGAAALGPRLDELAAAGRALNRRRRIDRDAIFKLKDEALRAIWASGSGGEAFADYCRRMGRHLERFAAYCALAVQHGGDWRAWPADFHDPQSPAVARFVAEQAGEVRYHQWLQWLLEEQLAAAGRAVKLLVDLPVGVHPGGADAWIWQDFMARNCTVGAPPDMFNPAGQDWAISAFAPHKLRAAGYEPFIQTLRASLRHAGGLRIDHVMALFRLYLIPQGLGPKGGAYIRYRHDELLAIVALESHRSGAIVIGEDLGNVEPGVREQLAEEGVLSYRVFLFEQGPPHQYPQSAMAAATTHDLPTIAGLWTCAHDPPPALELAPLPHTQEAMRHMRQHVNRFLELDHAAATHHAIETTYRRLAEAPSWIVAATLEDALAIHEQTNVPGTVSQWPNWSLALPGGIEALEQAPLARQIAQALNRK